MRDFRDAKAMAQTLRDAFDTKSVPISHSESLELVAKILGLHDWNTLAARIQGHQPAAGEPGMATSALSMSTGTVIPVTPMRDVVFFPQMVTPIFVGREKTMRALEAAMAGDGLVLVVTQRRGADDDPTLDDLYRVGVTARIIDRQTLLDGTLKFFVSCIERKTVVRPVAGEFLAAEVAPLKETGGESAEAADLSRAVLDAYQRYAKVDFVATPRGTPALFKLPSAGEPGRLADSVAGLVSAPIERKQQLLEAGDVIARLKLLLAVMEAGPPVA
ncbi:MAG: LON peptidase substrate-binding domain-containing protein [Proteobacteria bacterium]|nr:LON peptidase substrate-binding domain-containing protein [Pseudomonadota bacterium]